MNIIHANDPTTRFLSLLYNQLEGIKAHVTITKDEIDREMVKFGSRLRNYISLYAQGHPCENAATV